MNDNSAPLKVVKATILPAKSDHPLADRYRSVVVGVMTDGSEVALISYYADELHFSAREFEGLTREQARELFHRRDVAYLQS